ncbi:acetyl-CoA carboxylase biotin carboxyl carrier protein [Candidatus Sumerlaeota bacterium]|nr:acetyl-CoA carboxylase biotin carboxyl carrier protein [Candidatus Sumerlaeota bacterium]
MDFEQIKELISLCAKKQIYDLEVEQGDVRLRVKCGERTPKVKYTPLMTGALDMASLSAAQPPAPAQASATPAAEEEQTQNEASNLMSITAPMVGTFYQAPSPDSEPYVKVGDMVSKDTVLCIIEAMKLMNEIKAECNGRIVKIVVENGQPIEYGQPLFLIDPA